MGLGDVREGFADEDPSLVPKEATLEVHKGFPSLRTHFGQACRSRGGEVARASSEPSPLGQRQHVWVEPAVGLHRSRRFGGAVAPDAEDRSPLARGAGAQAQDAPAVEHLQVGRGGARFEGPQAGFGGGLGVGAEPLGAREVKEVDRLLPELRLRIPDDRLPPERLYVRHQFGGEPRVLRRGFVGDEMDVGEVEVLGEFGEQLLEDALALGRVHLEA